MVDFNIIPKDARAIDLTGKKFGSWLVIGFCGQRRWVCRCDCGMEKAVLGGTLRRGQSTKCAKCSARITKVSRRFTPEKMLSRHSGEPDDNGCILWTGRIGPKGYGEAAFRIDGKQVKMRAHRLAWEHAFGAIPVGLLVCHQCDVRRCINPKHLFLGTEADNSADMATKLRSTHGEKNPRAKLTDDNVREIRKLRSEGMCQRVIAEKFGVRQSMISVIVRGKNWKYIE